MADLLNSLPSGKPGVAAYWWVLTNLRIVGIHNVEYHQPLRNTYRKLLRDNPNEKPELLLQFAVKGMNGTLGPEEIVPSLLVFGEYPTAFTTSENPKSRSLAHLQAKWITKLA